MSLPKPTLPTYTLTLPSTKETITYRPFTMSEQKILLFALEGTTDAEIVRAIGQTVDPCTFGKIGIDTHPLFDVQFVFLHIRAKSAGEVAEFLLVCGECGHKIEAQIRLDEIKVEETEGHTDTIMLSDGMGVKMKYPKVEHLAALSNPNTPDDVFKVVAECVATIFTADEVFDCAKEPIEEVMEFLDSLTSEQFYTVRAFFETMPRLSHTIMFTCPKCERENEVSMDGIQSFFG